MNNSSLFSTKHDFCPINFGSIELLISSCNILTISILSLISNAVLGRVFVEVKGHLPQFVKIIFTNLICCKSIRSASLIIVALYNVSICVNQSFLVPINRNACLIFEFIYLTNMTSYVSSVLFISIERAWKVYGLTCRGKDEQKTLSATRGFYAYFLVLLAWIISLSVFFKLASLHTNDRDDFACYCYSSEVWNSTHATIQVPTYTYFKFI